MIDLIIEPRRHDIGGLLVSRVLPFVKRRAVGPFVFFDSYDTAVTPSADLDVRPHPHIGLSTVTYLFEGENVHRDSIGSVQAVRAGDLAIMTAARGIVHSERIDPDGRASLRRLRGAQLWLGLPAEREDEAPTFEHRDAKALPEIAPNERTRSRVLLGTAFGARSPIAHPSDPLFVDLELEPGARVELPIDVAERGVFVARGALRIGDSTLAETRLAVLTPNAPVTIEALEDARVLLIGGPPLGHRYMDWNFVSSSREAIARARAAWKNRQFASIPGDDVEYIPLPE